MAERSTISQVTQIGVETTPGTAVSASKRLSSMSINLSPNFEVGRFRAAGTKYMSVAAMNKEFAGGSISGVATYDEIIYPLSSVLDTATISDLGNGGQEWTFAPSTDAADTPKTFSIEEGSSVRAHEVTYALVTEFGIEVSRNGVNVSGSLIAQEFTDGITLTSSPTTLPLVPMLPGTFDVYIDSAHGDLGTTKLGRALSMNWRIGNRFNPLWVLDSSEPSWVAHVEVEPSLESELMVEANSDGMAYLTSLRNSEKLFVRLVATGPDVDPQEVTPDAYSFQLDQAVRVTNLGSLQDADGVYAASFTMTGTHDDDIGGPLEATVVCAQTAL